jgi:hypothetical protein
MCFNSCYFSVKGGSVPTNFSVKGGSVPTNFSVKGGSGPHLLARCPPFARAASATPASFAQHSNQSVVPCVVFISVPACFLGRHFFRFSSNLHRTLPVSGSSVRCGHVNLKQRYDGGEATKAQFTIRCARLVMLVDCVHVRTGKYPHRADYFYSAGQAHSVAVRNNNDFVSQRRRSTAPL